jgi:hypothetical protein
MTIDKADKFSRFLHKQPTELDHFCRANHDELMAIG